ncbi:DUF4429 domain-containing protein [Streptomyces beihaiensis]|uniref:DUF4429 domain-containing protein n=1 Tax=Streptomyces beihaiensis TaxID=2984495 RepID=A0ABT3TSI4_9ACTN|nr:DUF4429 domain-containing protein [Streptomyces beihaiensis]MCX3060008.1 DUF4429 domain-containing protein [Streptomyces beihaiensis]
MGDVLAGFHAAWELTTDSLLIRFERGIRTPKLLQVLGERQIPLEAVRTVTVTPGKRGTVVLHAEPRPGADPLMDAARGQLKAASDPYRLVLPAQKAELAERHADELRERLAKAAADRTCDAAGSDDDRPDAYLVAPPRVPLPKTPLQFKAYDGKASFDGSAVFFRWFWTGASSAKWKAGDKSFPVAELCGVEWRSPELSDGHLRLLRHGASEDRPAGQADQDPAAVVFGGGYGPVHESLPFAASVLAAVRAAGRTVPATAAPAGPSHTAPVPAPRRDPADIADRIRHLGELHQAGLVTDTEFSAKKAELLAEL